MGRDAFLGMWLNENSKARRRRVLGWESGTLYLDQGNLPGLDEDCGADCAAAGIRRGFPQLALRGVQAQMPCFQCYEA